MRPGQYRRMREAEDRHWWYRGLRSEVARVLERHGEDAKRLLDAGCGTGGMLAELRRWEAHGCDLSREAVDLCRGRGLEQVVVSSVHSLPYADGFFDVVLSLDVLYHEEVDEHLALGEMNRVLGPGGLLVTNLPAFDCLRGTHDRAVAGARRYRRRSVRTLLESHRFEILESYHWNAFGFLPLLLRRKFSHDLRGDLVMPPDRLNELLTHAVKADLVLCRFLRFLPGTSLLTVARSRID